MAATEHPETALEAVERAERRLDERSVERSGARERALRRRERRDRYRLPALALGAGVIGAVVFLATIEAAGGDLSDVPGLAANLIVFAALFVPPALAAWLARSEGWLVALAVGVCAFALELALAFGVGFLALGLGPS